MSLIMGNYLDVQYQTKITYIKEPYLCFPVPVRPFFSDMHLALGDETFCFWFHFFSEEKGYIRRVELGSKCCIYDLELVTPHIHLLRRSLRTTMEETLDYLSGFLCTGHKVKKKQFQTVELKVRMDCDGCELKVKKALSSINGMPLSISTTLSCEHYDLSACMLMGFVGVQSVDVDRKQQKATVTGYVEPNQVLRKAKSTGNKAELWPYLPYSLVTHPYTSGIYDKKAPSGYVRNVECVAVVSDHGGKQEDQLADMFSEDNPNSCSIM